MGIGRVHTTNALATNTLAAIQTDRGCKPRSPCQRAAVVLIEARLKGEFGRDPPRGTAAPALRTAATSTGCPLTTPVLPWTPDVHT